MKGKRFFFEKKNQKTFFNPGQQHSTIPSSPDLPAREARAFGATRSTPFCGGLSNPTTPC
jgi:hypothetical protein